MADDPVKSGRITVAALKGLNERNQDANSDLGEFDILKGVIPTIQNTLKRAHGCRLIYEFGEPVLALHQTNDSNSNLIVQLLSSVRIIPRFLDVGVNTNLVRIPST